MYHTSPGSLHPDQASSIYCLRHRTNHNHGVARGNLSDRFGPRPIVLIGSSALSAGVALASRVTYLLEFSTNVAAASAGGIRYWHVRQRVDCIRKRFTPFDADSRAELHVS